MSDTENTIKDEINVSVVSTILILCIIFIIYLFIQFIFSNTDVNYSPIPMTTPKPITISTAFDIVN